MACCIEGDGIDLPMATNFNSLQPEGMVEMNVVRARYERLLADVYGLRRAALRNLAQVIRLALRILLS
jgi:hypothetical protein